ncbi:carnitine dehydratase [Mycobacterium triplex]|uniref:Carnitine dehydratase n=3 Tax=Mycobacterium simiae complex TaxID=2249310 RepID=A0A024K6J1_9MYCO|nr:MULTISPECIES: CaiB/BaiF CoA-transferase family protein [Mycobacterium simiae complex]ORJ53847.1 CoA transferase [Mycobacterium simiae]ORX07631.1 carnitine dehydratase [Mycobacterium triplex]CDO91531.1 L-carnitine dehydratase/bile acid-inducible protein F [Mycobacterium triplex]SOX56978.1 CoA transferase [Mycobacterium ahvazicum]
MTTAPLAGITVVSLEQAVAAPYATRQLADLGARVIKVERPQGGDFARGYDRAVHGESSYFVWLNRRKESLTVDVKQPEGRRIVDRLLEGADVLVQNLAPGAAARLGLDAESVSRTHPQTITATISGYGQDGPWSDRKAYDLLVQAEAGLLSVTGSPDEVARTGVSIADIAAGMFTFSAILTALYTRATTGAIHPVSVSLFDALVEWVSQPLYYGRYGGTAPPRTGARHPTIAPYGPFTAGDGQTILLAVQNPAEWQRLCETVLGRTDLVADPRFATNPDRVANRDELEAIIAAAAARLSSEELEKRLQTAGVAHARMNDVDQLWLHPVLVGRDRWQEIQTPGGPAAALPPPAALAGVDPLIGDVPALGEHSRKILCELGYSMKAIDGLVAQGVTTA